jgi:energy-coupling factor transport system substrate-specific component
MAAFLYPFILPVTTGLGTEPTRVRATEAPIILAAVTMLCLLALLGELSTSSSASKMAALLGVLVAIDATLRLVPTLLGASPIFLLILLVGTVYGPAIGFVMGSLTLLVSAVLTGGIGPWLPFQMLGAGWIGLTAGVLPTPQDRRRRLILLAAFSAAWGLGYGALLNLYAWPYAAPGIDGEIGLYWSSTLSSGQAIANYLRFYLVTSLTYDVFRAVANASLVLLLGGPIIVVLERYRQRFQWEPWT